MVMAFVNTSVPEAASLVAQLDQLVKKHKAAGLRGYVVFQGGPKVGPEIAKLAAAKKISIPMAHSLTPGPRDPELAKWRINPAAKTTFVVSSGNRVTANLVNVDAKQFPKVAAAAAKTLSASG
jgi:hypothetical protein